MGVQGLTIHTRYKAGGNLAQWLGHQKETF